MAQERSLRQPSSIVYVPLLGRCAKQTQWSFGLQLLRDFRARRGKDDLFICGSSIHACEKSGQWPQALALLQQLDCWTLEGNVVVHGSVLSAATHGQGSEWASATALLCALQDQEIQSNVIIYSSSITATSLGQKWQEALQIFYSARAAGAVNLIVYNAAISACERGSETGLESL
ncbi:Putative pentatricopeptide repeat-containing protein At1g12700 [Durusdinium trenchii]|uniref:Mitochondrial n=1 Tax=Durusdinium trenchii TaxID=1381693 RepID=A0ABP0LPJ3_9DINO